MEDKDFEQIVRYLEKEYGNEADYFIGLNLTQDIEDAVNDNRSSVLDYIYHNYPDLYTQLFTNIFIRPYGGFSFYNDLVPHLNLKYLIKQLEGIIPQREEPEKGRLLDLYQHFHNYLVINTVIKENRKKPRYSEKLLLSMLPGSRQLEFENQFADNELIENSRAFLESHNRNTLRVFENQVMGLPPPDSFEEMEYQYHFWAENAKGNPLEVRKLIDFYESLMDEMVLGLINLDLAENIVDLLIKDFGEYPDVEFYFLQTKAVNQKLEEVKAFIEDKYTPEEIEETPLFLSYLCEYYQLIGEIPKAVELSKKAYEVSDYNPNYLTEYCKVLLLKDKNEAKDLLKQYIFDDGNDLLPSQILFLIPRFIKDDIKFVKRMLDYYSERYPEEEIQNRGLHHIQYLNLLARYYFEIKNYPMYEITLEKMIKEYPDNETGYRRLSEFYSRSDIKEFYDIAKAFKNARKCAEIRGISSDYYIGNCYLISMDYSKAIETLEKFANKEDIHPSYYRVFQHLFKACLLNNQKKQACKWAGKYLDTFDQPSKLFMYRGPTMFTEDLLESDLFFFALVANNCIKHRKRAERYLRERESWENAVSRSFEIQERIKENQNLKEQIVEIEKELQLIKKKYSEVDFSKEENVESFFNEIMENETARANILQQINQDLWNEAEKKILNIIPDYEKLPDVVINFIKTSEFLLLASHENSDFSGVILSYAKAFETILDEKISRRFIEMIKMEKEKPIITKESDITVKYLFPRRGQERKSITIGQWYVFIDNSFKGRYHSADNITRKFETYVNKLKKTDLDNIRILSDNLKDTRNGGAHTKFINRKDAESDIDNFREAINQLITIFYSNKQ